MMMVGLLLVGPAEGPVCDAAAAEGIKVTILYDNTTAVDGTQADWGFSALVEGGEKTILFDTGTKPEILKHNVEELGVDLSGVDVVIFSHEHGDHTGGINFALEKIKGVPVYFGASFRQGFDARVRDLGSEPIRIKDPYEICPGIFSTGEMSGPAAEQSLIFDTGEGLTVMTGCAHPGVDKIVARARELHGKPVTFVFGGFHLMQKTRPEVDAIIGRFAESGVIRCGATHCTGEKQIGWFQEHYKDHYVPMGVGRIIPISD
jgi:7,8-dihydropterin-6-yl-methyl-4-(beta-D-ribofuranosyl)aminobenzene 5'-phosphate synthase